MEKIEERFKLSTLMNCNYVKNEKYVNYKDLPHRAGKIIFSLKRNIINRFLIEQEKFSLIDRLMGFAT